MRYFDKIKLLEFKTYEIFKKLEDDGYTFDFEGSTIDHYRLHIEKDNYRIIEHIPKELFERDPFVVELTVTNMTSDILRSILKIK